MALGFEGSQRVYTVSGGQIRFRYIGRELRTAELIAAGSLNSAVLKDTLRIGFEQLALQEVYVSGQIREGVYESNGFRRRESSEGLWLRDDEWRTTAGLGPRVALMQPQFLPWLGYFELIDRADVFVFLDDFQFLRRSWGQRNRLFAVRGKVGTVTLPVAHEDNQEATFVELREAETITWRRKLVNLLSQNYSRAPFGEFVLTLVREWLAGSYLNIAELEIALITKVACYLGLGARLVRSSSLAVQGLRRSNRLLAILEKVGAGTYLSAHGSFPYMKEDGVFPRSNLPVYFQSHMPRQYAQHGSCQFVPRLSCLDALANLPRDEVRVIVRGTDWWQSWQEREAEEGAGLRHPAQEW